MKTDTLFYVAWIALAVEIIWAINTARLAKKQTLPSTMVTPAALAFVAFHACWWTSQFKPGENIFAYIIGVFASIAFLFGTSFVSTGCMKLTDQGELCINKDNKVFQVIKKIPIKFDGRSLCSISWLAAIAIFFLPILMSAMAVVSAAVATVICLWTWQNPWEYYKEIIELTSWPETKVRRNKRGWWISPTPYIAGLAAVAGIVFIGISYNQYFSKMIIVSGVILVLYVCSLLMVNLVIKKWAKMPQEEKETIDPNVKYTIENLQHTSFKTIDVWNVFWQIFKQKYCPTIKYCDQKEMLPYWYNHIQVENTDGTMTIDD